MRDRLIDLLKDTLSEWECDVTDVTIKEIADHLLANGVIVPPCRVGGKVYTLSRGKIKEWKVCFIGFNTRGEIKLNIADKGYFNMLEVWNYDFGKHVFLTKEEAERALAERSKQ